MMPTMSIGQLAERLDAINDELIRRQDPNLRAWSQTQLRPGKAEAWEQLGKDICQLCRLVETYYEQIDEFWGPSGGPRPRPVVLRDPTLLDAFRAMLSFRDSLPKGLCREKTSKVQRQTWRLLMEFPEAHGRFLQQLRGLVS